MAWSKTGNLKGPKGNDGANATDSQVASAASTYLQNNAAAFKGNPGDPGQRGSRITAGSGAPTTVSGQIVGDLYLDQTTGDLYQLS